MLSITVAPVLRTPDAPCDPRVSFVAVVRAADDSELAPASSTTIYSGMVARSPVMLQIFQLIERLEESDATVLITGPSGTGKELVARAIHSNSTRRNGPFVAVNCGALPGDLLESELFGHVKGAFTGAVRDREGRFEYASGGTIFLDEVGDLPLHLQVKLLRVLQERTYERVGESRPRKADARVIAATNRDMKRAVLDGQFRDDLYYRLRVVPIHLPSLHERREDIEPLARFLLSRVNRRHDRSVRLAPDAMAALLRYHWPGNVRELENALEYALAVTSGQTIHAQDFPEEVLQAEFRHALPEERGKQAVTAAPVRAPLEEWAPGRALSAKGPERDWIGVGPERGSMGSSSERDWMVSGSERDSIASGSERDSISTGSERSASGITNKYDAERRRIRAALESHRWNRSETAEALGLSRSTLWRKMREYGLIR